MGQRITQRIYDCDVCGRTPEDQEHMWEMGSEVWCKDCCDDAENGSDDDQDEQEK